MTFYFNPCINSNYCCLECFFRGFTKINRAEYLKLKSENRIMPDGVNAKVNVKLHVNSLYCMCEFIVLHVSYFLHHAKDILFANLNHVSLEYIRACV